VIADPGAAGARSRAKTNEYRSTTLSIKARCKLPRCNACGSYRYDDAVTGPDPDALCGPRFCSRARALDV
jgi:hypothetical protein